MKINGRKAFSLIELSIVLLIISIMVAGTVTVSTAIVTKSKIELTKKRMDEIYKAMGQYLLRNYALPCPASLRVAKTAASYGVAGEAGTCGEDGIYQSNLNSQIVYGAVPVNSLGLPSEMAEDGFGTKFGYAINKNFTTIEYPTATNLNGFSFNGSTTNMIRVYEHPSTNMISGVVFVLVSHGANKSGGFNSTATSVQNNVSFDTYEIDNHLSSATDNVDPAADTANFGNNISYSLDVTFAASDLSSSVFDDILFYKRRNDFVEDFKAMFLIPCDGTVITPTSFTSVDAYYGQIVTNSACALSTSQSRKCEAYGAWVNIEGSCM